MKGSRGNGGYGWRRQGEVTVAAEAAGVKRRRRAKEVAGGRPRREREKKWAEGRAKNGRGRAVCGEVRTGLTGASEKKRKGGRL